MFSDVIKLIEWNEFMLNRFVGDINKPSKNPDQAQSPRQIKSQRPTIQPLNFAEQCRHEHGNNWSKSSTRNDETESCGPLLNRDPFGQKSVSRRQEDALEEAHDDSERHDPDDVVDGCNRCQKGANDGHCHRDSVRPFRSKALCQAAADDLSQSVPVEVGAQDDALGPFVPVDCAG